MNIKKASIDEKIGQRFIFGINDVNIEPLIELIKNCHIGGIILYGKNYRNYSDMLDVIKRCKETNKGNIPLFIAIDQEGGIVNRMPSEIHNLKNIYDLSKKDSSSVSEYANIICTMLSQSGINMNLSPVLDIYNNSRSKVLVKRCFYGNSKEVTECGIRYVNESNKNKIVSVIKHFPGHGASVMDSHFLVPYIYNYKEIFSKHIKPFESLFEISPAVMLGHLAIRKHTGILPVTMSSNFVNKFIRKDNNYNGIVMTDEINMLKRHFLYRFNYVNKILKADNDIVLVKINDIEEGYKIIDVYKKMLENNESEMNKLEGHFERIMRVKDRYNINDSVNYDGLDIEDINKRIDNLNKLVIE